MPDEDLSNEYRSKIAYYLLNPETNREDHANKIKADISNRIQAAQKQQEYTQADTTRSDNQKIADLQEQYQSIRKHKKRVKKVKKSPNDEQFVEAINAYEYYKRQQLQDQKMLNQIKKYLNEP